MSAPCIELENSLTKDKKYVRECAQAALHYYNFVVETEKDMHFYFFTSPAHGPCRMLAKTSGKHGFGAPKTFIVTSLDPALRGTYTLRYRDTAKCLSPTGVEVRNIDLIMAAIGQFCTALPALNEQIEEELLLADLRFTGEVKNRYGRIMSPSGFVSRRTTIDEFLSVEN